MARPKHDEMLLRAGGRALATAVAVIVCQPTRIRLIPWWWLSGTVLGPVVCSIGHPRYARKRTPSFMAAEGVYDFVGVLLGAVSTAALTASCCCGD